MQGKKVCWYLQKYEWNASAHFNSIKEKIGENHII